MTFAGARVSLQISRRNLLVLGFALLVTLGGAALLLYGLPVAEASGAPDRLPIAANAPAVPAAPPVSATDVNENFRRAVRSELARNEDVRPLPHPVAADKPAASPTPLPVPGGTAEVALVVATAGSPLNVRARPGMAAPVIGSLQPGTRLRGIGVNADGEWLLVHIPRTSEPGWVFAGLVEVTAGDVAALRRMEVQHREE